MEEALFLLLFLFFILPGGLVIFISDTLLGENFIENLASHFLPKPDASIKRPKLEALLRLSIFVGSALWILLGLIVLFAVIFLR